MGIDAVMVLGPDDSVFKDGFVLLELGSNELLEGSLLADDDAGMLADELGSALSEKLVELLDSEGDETGRPTLLVELGKEDPPSKDEGGPVA